ncbi:hypothetical protein LCGC14_2811080 [marine sediment metagenome]|uniref:Uncharacterized protein n=1 Tax=marine sediment metagenome TaxID=412755 RepID=A0A0F8YJT7_9ZZZZ
MKIRDGFVSNSSSSSFVISRQDITAKQLYQIINHEALASSFGTPCPPEDAWSIDDTLAEVVSGSCWMDSFNMREFMENIGVDVEKVKWDS